MEMEKLKDLIDKCINNQSYENYDLFEETLRESLPTLEELYSLKEDISLMKDNRISLLDEMSSKKSIVMEEYYQIARQFKMLDEYEENKKAVFNSLKAPSLGTILLVVGCRIFSVRDMHELSACLMTLILAVVVVAPVTYNRKRLTLINKLEKFGDLDDLMMHFYNDSEQGQGLYDAISLEQRTAGALDYCLARIDNVIYDAEEIEEEPIQYVRA